jgi:hypothetical protein
MLRNLFTGLAVGALAVSVLPAAGPPVGAIDGNYIEARTADVWTGPCFANGEVEINGKEAVLGWRIEHGGWQGVSLAGLSVAAVIRTEHTLGNVSEPVNPARAVLIVDSRAGAAERAALESFARYMGGDLLRNVVQVYYSPIELTIENGNIHGGAARLTAGSLASVETRALNEGDRHCGNEMIYYPPLSEKLDHSMPAYAEANSYQGGGLGETWSAPERRSGFLGTFRVDGE